MKNILKAMLLGLIPIVVLLGAIFLLYIIAFALQQFGKVGLLIIISLFAWIGGSIAFYIKMKD